MPSKKPTDKLVASRTPQTVSKPARKPTVVVAKRRKTAAPAVGPQLSGAAINARLDELNRLSCEPERLTRLYLSPSHSNAVDLVASWMQQAGMVTRLDDTASLIGRYEGTTPDLPALLIGSHIDSVRNAGRFDGPLGVLTGIAVVDDLNRRSIRFPFAIEVVAFGDEEGVRFPTTLTGSRALAGLFDPKCLDETDQDGITRRDALTAIGCRPERIASAAKAAGDALGYVEVHIEQGPVLEQEGLALGVVTAINGASRGRVTITGQSGHAGTVPMAMRRDALAAAAEMILAVETRAASEPDLVATAGQLEIANAATNTVPGDVAFTLDIRSPVDATRQAAVRDITALIARIAGVRGVSADVAVTYDAPAALSDARLVAALAASLVREKHPERLMASGAGHDAMAFKGRIPFAMLFVRSKGGISHNPAEFTSSADIEAAAKVLAGFVASYGR